MGGLDSPHDDPDWWKNSSSPGEEIVHLPEEIAESVINIAHELDTTVGRVMDAVMIESGVFDDEELIGVDAGAFKHGGKIHYTQEGLLRVKEIKDTFQLTDDDLNGVINSLTREGHYVEWSQIEEHFSQIQELTSEIKDGGDE